MTQINDRFAQIIADADAAETQEALETAIRHLDSLLTEGFAESGTPPRPYAPALAMSEAFQSDFITPPEGGAEGHFRSTIGQLTVDVANRLARAKRRAGYRLKTLFGFDGIRIVEEGDSWTQYPILLEDIGDQLHARDDLAVFSVGAAGDLASNIAAQKEYLAALEKTGASALLVSFGGNDLFAQLESSLTDFVEGAEPAQMINDSVLMPLLDGVIENYRTVLSDVAAGFPSVTVFTHGYDLPYPLEGGKWMGPALDAHGIPYGIGRKVIAVILDRFNSALSDLTEHHANMVYCDLRGTVDRGPSSWFDELHPKNAGYGRAAQKVESAIRGAHAGGAETARRSDTVAGPTGGAERSATRTVVLDPGHGGTTTIGGSSPNNAVGPRGTLEKTLTLDVALKARDMLEDRGMRVLLTRDTDRNLSLADRAAVARRAGAEVFVSIHFNGSRAHNAQGTETFVHSTLPDGPHVSKALCRAVQAEMVAALGLRDRNLGFELGAKRGGFGVINPARHAPRTAAVLHEVSFLDRADEENRLSTLSYRRKIARALADGIETYLSGIAPAESASAAEAEMGDAIELMQHGETLVAEAARLFDWQGGAEYAAPPAADGTDVSNGHLLGQMHEPGAGASAGPVTGPVTGSVTGPDFITSLAESEARFVAGHDPSGAAMSEGAEPPDFDPAVEASFAATSRDAAANRPLMARLFANAETAGFSHARFEAFILGLGLRHFSPSEFLVQGSGNASGNCAGKNTMPPEPLWPNIANTARMIDEIRERLGAPVYITSAYRAPAYNACIGGVAQSQHMRFNALDWYCTAHSRAHWRRVAEAVRASDPARFDGFIDDYASGNFVHIDTRRS